MMPATYLSAFADHLSLIGWARYLPCHLAGDVAFYSVSSLMAGDVAFDSDLIYLLAGYDSNCALWHGTSLLILIYNLPSGWV